jgi:hypothetical protein
MSNSFIPLLWPTNANTITAFHSSLEYKSDVKTLTKSLSSQKWEVGGNGQTDRENKESGYDLCVGKGCHTLSWPQLTQYERFLHELRRKRENFGLKRPDDY